MKRNLAVSGLSTVLFFALACSVSTSSDANTTNTAAATNAAKRPAQPTNAANAPASNASDSGSANATSPSSAQDTRLDFTLVNSTGVEIHKLFVSPHEKDDWGEDILGRDTLPNGQRGQVTFSRTEKATVWDMRIEDSEGNSIEWESLNLLEISKVTLHYENGRAWAETE
jgi:hypothetical protein